MEAKNIMIRLDNFLKKEESKELFSMLGKTITVEDGWITMRKGRKKEEVLLLQDDNNRVRIKGKDTAISLRQNDDDYVVDHIQTGDIENQDINFSMRMIKDKKVNIVLELLKMMVKLSAGLVRMKFLLNIQSLKIKSTFIEEKIKLILD